MVKALFIDFDGTLVDSLGLLYQMYADFLISFGATPSYEEFEALNGSPLESVLEKLISTHLLPLTLEEALEKYFQEVEKRYLNEVSLTSGAKHFLEKMKKAHVKLVLVTAAKRKLIQPILQKHQLHFDEVVSGDDVQRGKPHPEIYLKALNKMQVDPHEVFAIEDSQNGMTSARLAGIYCFQFSPQNSWETLAQTILSEKK